MIDSEYQLNDNGFKEECLEYKESSKFKYSFNSVWMSDREKWEEIISKNDAFAS